MEILLNVLFLLVGMVLMAGAMYIVNKTKKDLVFGAIPFVILTLLGWVGLVLVVITGAFYAFAEFGIPHIKAIDAKMRAHFQPKGDDSAEEHH